MCKFMLFVAGFYLDKKHLMIFQFPKMFKTKNKHLIWNQQKKALQKKSKKTKKIYTKLRSPVKQK